MRAAKVEASLRIRAVSPEPPLLAHTRSESRRTFRQKTRSLAPLNGRQCAFKMCHDRMFEDTNSLDAAHNMSWRAATDGKSQSSSYVARKPVIGVCDQVRLKPAYSVTEGSYSLESLDIASRGNILSKQWITKRLIRLPGCAG